MVCSTNSLIKFEPGVTGRTTGQSESKTYRDRMLSHNLFASKSRSLKKSQPNSSLESQNRTKEEQTNVITSLGKADDTAITGVSAPHGENKAWV